MPRHSAIYCSFCGIDSREVERIIAGPSVYICDRCLILCLDILIELKHQGLEKVQREALLLAQEQRLAGIIEQAKVKFDELTALISDAKPDIEPT